jgi:uncharacterized protein (DUF736 family)
MAYEQKPGQGALFKNKKEKETQPDYKGTIIADRDYQAGDKIELASWVKTPKNGGEKFMSLSISRPREEKPASTYAARTAGDDLDLDDGVPF